MHTPTEDQRLTREPPTPKQLDKETVYNLLRPTVKPSIKEIFQKPIKENNCKKYIPENTRCSSLGGVHILCGQILFHYSDKLRCKIQDSDRECYDLPVTCDTLKKCFPPENGTKPILIYSANQWLQKNSMKIILRIGLARAWDGGDKNWRPRRCYLQLNGIICEKTSPALRGR